MALGDLAFEETGKFAGIRALPDKKVEATYQGSGKFSVQTIRLLYRGRNPAWRNLDCRVQWNLHNQRWGLCRCVGSWKRATYRKWPKGELAGWSYLAGFAEICKIK